MIKDQTPLLEEREVCSYIHSIPDWTKDKNLTELELKIIPRKVFMYE